MSPDTFEALIAVAVGLLPGALFIWSFEQEAGRWGSTASDRIQTFVGASAILLVLVWPLAYEVYLDVSEPDPAGRLMWRGWLAGALYIAIPVILGRLVGRGARRRTRWASAITGPAPAPRAWDHLFAGDSTVGWILVRLKSGEWVGGLWGRSETNGLNSYAAGYPEAQDLLISDLALLENGAFVVDESGSPQLTGVSLLVRWDEIQYLKFM